MGSSGWKLGACLHVLVALAVIGDQRGRRVIIVPSCRIGGTGVTSDGLCLSCAKSRE
jgi:hypothetical protein